MWLVAATALSDLHRCFQRMMQLRPQFADTPRSRSSPFGARACSNSAPDGWFSPAALRVSKSRSTASSHASGALLGVGQLQTGAPDSPALRFRRRYRDRRRGDLALLDRGARAAGGHGRHQSLPQRTGEGLDGRPAGADAGREVFVGQRRRGRTENEHQHEQGMRAWVRSIAGFGQRIRSGRGPSRHRPQVRRSHAPERCARRGRCDASRASFGRRGLGGPARTPIAWLSRTRHA